MRATIRDVAREAGVSIATVSRTMRDPGSVRVETRERVEAVASRLEYVPSQLGRQLAERRHAANGIVFPDLSGPYFAEVVLGYEAVAGELGRSVLILSTAGRDDADRAVAAMAERCDGLVVLGQTISDAAVTAMVRRGTPVVLVARPSLDGIDSVRAHNLDGARALAHHVLDTGATDVAFVGDPGSGPDVAERHAGVAAVVAERGARLRLWPVTEMDEAAGEHLAAGLGTRDLPDALVCANDEMALGLLGALAERGVRVPDDVVVTGWDDVMAARYAGLTTVRQPMREIGATAARLLDERISGARVEVAHEVLPTTLVPRDTTSSPTPRKVAR
ncbi:LacI family DNA-binding transcriptional regulator [Nocardioides aequoreus]|uniref:LacI family DNA-binding transcriptional regulator n=1 Tax=Nocardioides aequoreus TaxID=397278 RepID=UPI0004C2C0CA|nr:LacI family DNA-binding transcriptional regulator [Nocardioides aequoreus]